MRFWICRHFAAEARAAIAGVPELAQATIHAFPACCGCPALSVAAIREQIATIPADEPMVWIGGICLQPLLMELADERRIQLHLFKQCFHLVADPDWVDAQLRDGAYLCTPGWLANWPDHLARMGLTTPELARDLFGDSIQRLVLLDTGQDPQAAARLTALSTYVGRSAETVPMGLGYLRLYLIRLAERLSRDAERQQAAAQLADARGQASEVVMAMDFLGRLATAPHQSETIIQLLDLLTALFAPQQLFYVGVENGQLQPPVTAQPLPDAQLEAVAEFFAGTAPYTEIDAGQGFLLRICHGAETLRASKTRYHTLFTSMQEGFALYEIICDSQGRPVDYRFMDMNPAFEYLTGLKRENLIGRTVREVLPGTEKHWIQRYGAVALTGVAQRFENFSDEPNRHYDVYAYSLMRGGWRR